MIGNFYRIRGGTDASPIIFCLESNERQMLFFIALRVFERAIFFAKCRHNLLSRHQVRDINHAQLRVSL